MFAGLCLGCLPRCCVVWVVRESSLGWGWPAGRSGRGGEGGPVVGCLVGYVGVLRVVIGGLVGSGGIGGRMGLVGGMGLSVMVVRSSGWLFVFGRDLGWW